MGDRAKEESSAGAIIYCDTARRRRLQVTDMAARWRLSPSMHHFKSAIQNRESDKIYIM